MFFIKNYIFLKKNVSPFKSFSWFLYFFLYIFSKHRNTKRKGQIKLKKKYMKEIFTSLVLDKDRSNIHSLYLVFSNILKPELFIISCGVCGVLSYFLKNYYTWFVKISFHIIFNLTWIISPFVASRVFTGFH
jgi:hypothetical protein